MHSSDRKSTAFIPPYDRNAVLQLIIACGVGYVAFLFTAVCFQAFARFSFPAALTTISPYVALPAKAQFLSHFWTVFTFGWSHFFFWDWASNMIWLFCFGSLLQSLVGYKQLIPLFFLANTVGGLFYIAAQYLPVQFALHQYGVMGAQAGVMAFGTAAFTIAPSYKFNLGPAAKIPAWVILLIFIVLMVLRVNAQIPMLVLLAGGALTGFVYARLLKSGYNPGNKIYSLGNKLGDAYSPPENKHKLPFPDINQNIIDDILDKINQKGYQSLTEKERELLQRAGRENKL